MKQPKGRVSLRRQNPGAPGLGWRGPKHAGNTLPPEEHKGPPEPRKLAQGQPEVPEGLGLSGRSARGFTADPMLRRTVPNGLQGGRCPWKPDGGDDGAF